MKYSVSFGTFQILEENVCYFAPLENTYHCYNGSWVAKLWQNWKDEEYDEVGYYRIVETSCQADAYPSEYIQQN